MNKPLSFNFILSIPEIELTINNLDMDFDILKTNDADVNYARLNLWNLEQTKYRQLITEEHTMNIFMSFGEDTPVLIFSGQIKLDAIKHGCPPGRVDKSTKLTLLDGYPAYKTFINKNYREKVSSQQIIQDIIRETGLSEGQISENLPVNQYSSFKAYGYAPSLIQKICAPLGINFWINNNLVNLTAADTIEREGYLLNHGNCGRIRYTGENRIIIPTGLTPHLAPNDFVECDFEEFKGCCKIQSIHHFGNNYGRACITEITVEVPNE